jgi:hypothetical protein
MMPRQIKASEFKTRCVAFMEEVARTFCSRGRYGTSSAIGLPFFVMMIATPARGILKDELFVTGDIISPIDIQGEALK